MLHSVRVNRSGSLASVASRSRLMLTMPSWKNRLIQGPPKIGISPAALSSRSRPRISWETGSMASTASPNSGESASVSTPPSWNQSEAGCSTSLLTVSYPAARTTSASPVQSTNTAPSYATRPRLFCTTTCVSRSPATTTSENHEWYSGVTPASSNRRWAASFMISSLAGKLPLSRETSAPPSSAALVISSNGMPPMCCLPKWRNSLIGVTRALVAMPPTKPYRSMSSVLAPLRAAAVAATRPAGPPPHTMTS